MAEEISTEQTGTNSLDYFDMLRRSFSIVKNRKYLWFLGILAGASGSGMNSYGGSGNGWDTNSGTNVNMEQFFNTISTWIQSHIVLIMVVAGVLIAIGLTFWILSVMAQAGLINAADRIDSGEESSFMQSMRFGWHKFWRVVGINLLLGLLTFGILLAVATPAILLAVTQAWPLFALYLVPAILFTILSIIVVGIVSRYALRFAVVTGSGIMDSIRQGYGLMKSKKKESSLLFLMNILIGIISGIVVFIAVVVMILALGLLGLVIWLASSSVIAVIIYAVLAVVLSVSIMMLLGGFFSAITSTYWTLAFKEVSK